MLRILSWPPRSQALNLTFLCAIYSTLLPMVGVVSTALPNDLSEGGELHLVEECGFASISQSEYENIESFVSFEEFVPDWWNESSHYYIYITTSVYHLINRQMEMCGNERYQNHSSFLFSFSLCCLNSHLLVIFLKSCQVFSCFWKFSFLHSFTDIPMNECSFCIHEIEFVIESRKDFSNCCCVWDHATSSHNFGQVTTRDNSWRLIVDSDLETCWTPINKLNCSFCFDCCNSSVDILGHNISSVHHRAGHIFSMSWITFCHHICWLKARVCDLGYRELLMIGLFCWNDWRVRSQHEVNSWVRNQVCLEFSHINIKSTIKSQGSCQGRDHLRNESVQVCVGRSLNIKVSSADIVDGFIVKHHCNISMFQKRMSGENRVVRFDNCCWNLRRGIDCETKLRLLSIVNWESLEKKRSKTRSSSSSNWVEHQESLQSSAVVCKLSDSVKT